VERQEVQEVPHEPGEMTDCLRAGFQNGDPKNTQIVISK
jgi:hypothetical protein